MVTRAPHGSGERSVGASLGASLLGFAGEMPALYQTGMQLSFPSRELATLEQEERSTRVSAENAAVAYELLN